MERRESKGRLMSREEQLEALEKSIIWTMRHQKLLRQRDEKMRKKFEQEARIRKMFRDNEIIKEDEPECEER